MQNYFNRFRTTYQNHIPIITTPIFYVNSDPHLGHFSSAILADAMKRWSVLKGRSALLSTGTDEHGLKIQQAADIVKLDPKLHVDKISARFKVRLISLDFTDTKYSWQNVFDKGNVSYDRFIRTTDKDHIEMVQRIWRHLETTGRIYKGKHAGWYSVSDETFYPESQIMEELDTHGDHVKTGKQVEWIEEENYMFRLSQYQKDVLKWLQSSPSVLMPKSRMNEVVSLLEMGSLPDLSISRPVSRQKWGIPVPGDSKQTIYVWIDALANYLTVAHSLKTCPSFTHIIGKDIIKFHAVYWPALLMALDLPLPEKIIAHAHWTIGHVKMSKSLGNVVDPSVLLEKYGTDAVRYFILRDGGISDDCAFTEDLLRMRYQIELADQLGNLLSRCLGKAVNPHQIVPFVNPNHVKDEDLKVRDVVNRLRDECDEYFKDGEFSKGLTNIIKVVQSLNQYLQRNEPWKIAKQDNVVEKERVGVIINMTLESLRVIGIILQPIMPETMSRLLDTLNVDKRMFKDAVIDDVSTQRQGTKLSSSKLILFPRLPPHE